MHYDPIKRTLGEFFNQTPALRKVFYKLLDLLLLRAWHVHRELKKWRKTAPEKAHILATLELTGGVVEGDKGAARLLEINPSTLRSRMRKLGIGKHES